MTQDKASELAAAQCRQLADELASEAAGSWELQRRIRAVPLPVRYEPMGGCTCAGPDGPCAACISNEEAYNEWLTEPLISPREAAAYGLECVRAALQSEPSIRAVAPPVDDLSTLRGETPEQALERVCRKMDAEIAKLRDGDLGDLDPELLDEARKTLDALVARNEPLLTLHKELNKFKWIGADKGWDLAIEAVRRHIEEVVGWLVMDHAKVPRARDQVRSTETAGLGPKGDEPGPKDAPKTQGQPIKRWETPYLPERWSDYAGAPKDDAALSQQPAPKETP